MNKTKEKLLLEMQELRLRLEETEETLRSIQRYDAGADSHEQVLAPDGTELYRMLIEGMSGGVALLSSDGSIIYCNRYFAKMLKVSPEELAGRRIHHVVSMTDQPALQELLYQGRTGSSKRKIALVAGDGTQVAAILSISVLHAEPAFCLVAMELTGQEYSKEIIKSEKTTCSRQAGPEVLTMVSHELRAPLTSIVGYSILLKEKKFGKLGKKQEFYVDSIITNSRYLLDAVNGILDHARMRAGKIEPVIENISVPEAVDEALDMIKERALEKNIVLKKQFDPRLGCIEADRLKFKQILFNLLSNAMKFSRDEGGTITVTTRKEGDMAHISISDTGIGIKKNDMQRLFKEFEQLEPGISRKYGGAGLGLAISKQLVEMHGGRITAQSRYGEGSTFTFMLPVIARK